MSATQRKFMEIPKFKGGDPFSWLFKVYKFSLLTTHHYMIWFPLPFITWKERHRIGFKPQWQRDYAQIGWSSNAPFKIDFRYQSMKYQWRLLWKNDSKILSNPFKNQIFKNQQFKMVIRWREHLPKKSHLKIKGLVKWKR